MHFVERLDQKEIASRIHTSRSTVSRMIRDAMDRGIVDIRIRFPMQRERDLEESLRTSFNLRLTRVAPGNASTDQKAADSVGRLGADLVDTTLPPGGTLAVCWGRTISRVVDHLSPRDPGDQLRVVQMIGSLHDSDDETNGYELARVASKKLGAALELLSAPLIVDDAHVAKTLLQQTAISRVIDRARHSDLALVGLGSVAPATSALVRAGFVSAHEALDLARAGAVGDISGMLIDSDGQPVATGVSSRVIGVSLDDLTAMNAAVAVAYGPDKVAIIRAAIAGGYLDGLVTDQATATALLQTTSPPTEGVLS